VVDARRGGGVDQLDEARGEVAGPRGLAALVVDHGQGLVRAGEAHHGLREIAAVRPVEPGRADHVAALGVRREHELLALGLGATVGREGPPRLVLAVRARRGPVEDVVGRDLHDRRTDLGGGEGEVLRAERVDAARLLLVALGVVDAGVRGAVEDGVVPRDSGADGVEVGDVEVAAAEGRDGTVAEDGAEVGAEHAGGAREEEGHPFIMPEASDSEGRPHRSRTAAPPLPPPHGRRVPETRARYTGLRADPRTRHPRRL
jgi:hypothetical protein